MSTRNEHLSSIADTIKDYRHGEIAAPDAAHVDRWVGQFAAEVQLPILSELDHVLKHTYLSREAVTTFLASLITNAELTGAVPCGFWRGVNFLNNQGAGNSQRELVSLFDSLLSRSCGSRVADCGANATTFMYIDDAIFTGNRVLKDLTTWIKTSAPADAKVHVIAIAFHSGCQQYVTTGIEKAAKAASKQINLNWWCRLEIENCRQHADNSDVLWPRTLGDNALVKNYAAKLKRPLLLRTQDSIGEHKFFSSEQGRAVLEQEMLKAGAKIREMCPHLNEYQRPLGNMVLETLGFGSTIVTFRNCPNNAPLAFWAGNPWYPLFARKIN